MKVITSENRKELDDSHDYEIDQFLYTVAQRREGKWVRLTTLYNERQYAIDAAKGYVGLGAEVVIVIRFSTDIVGAVVNTDLEFEIIKQD